MCASARQTKHEQSGRQYSTLPAAAAMTDRSTFELRWAEALGPPGSDKAVDFVSCGGVVGSVDKAASKECALLKNAGFKDVSNGDEFDAEIKFLDLGHSEKFLGLEKQGRYFFVRPCYESLYQQVAAWSVRGADRVLVYGKAGTGKSWFQFYALRRLLQGYGQEHQYLFVLRQTRETLRLIDLSNGVVRLFSVEPKHLMTDCLDLFDHKRVLYFFEPVSDRSILPEPVQLSSLTTLSPFEERIHEYRKNRFTKLLFPVWCLEHLLFVANADPNILLDMEEVHKGFARLGGIIRHVFAYRTNDYEDEQTRTINNADLTILHATTTGIDSDPKAPGNNFSGYLLSYCNIDTRGPNRFMSADLDFTSDYVRGQIRERMQDYSIQERIQVVVDHLNGRRTDRGGLHLQETVSYLLSQGSSVAWKFKHVPDHNTVRNERWFSLVTQKRALVKSYTTSEELEAPAKLLVSTNPNFPLADIVITSSSRHHDSVVPSYMGNISSILSESALHAPRELLENSRHSANSDFLCCAWKGRELCCLFQTKLSQGKRWQRFPI